MKILAIGNSFSDDSMEYLGELLKNIGEREIVLGNLYIGGCSINRHLECLKENLPEYEYRTNDGNGWKTTFSYKSADALQSQNWDIVVMQQYSGESGVPASYEKLPYLLSLVKKFTPNAKFVWNMTWAYQSDATHPAFAIYGNDQKRMYEKIVETVREMIVKEKSFLHVIPTGTAIQNVRAVYGDTITRDGFHLSFDFGRYIAGLTWLKVLTAVDLEKVSYRPQGVDKAMQTIAIRAVENAVKNPFCVME